MVVRRKKMRKGLTLVEMAVVLLIIGLLLSIVGSMLANVAALKSSGDEATLLKNAMLFARKSAVRSNRTVHIEFNLDEEIYRVYRMDRSGEKPKEDVIIKPRELSSSNSLIAVAPASGNRITEGIVNLDISPLGTGEELAVYMGDDPEIKATIIFHKYGEGVDIHYKEVIENLEVPEWSEDLENF